jgi:hypothetical protein
LNFWRACLVALALAGAASAQAQIADPRVDWHTADSEHFRVHYRATQRAQAEAVARAAERAWPKVTADLQWEPRGRTEIAVYSEIDQANGFATPLPFSLIGVILAPPDEGQLLENSAWLDLLLVHELTHVVHMDKVRGVPRVLQAIFGRTVWWLPNVFNPGWAVEGLAVYEESDAAAGRGRLHGPIFEAWLRAERAHGFISLRELNADGRALPLSKQYLYGAYFYEFLARRYGAQAPRAFVERYSGNVLPRLHSNPVRIAGKPMDVLWREFLVDLAAQVDASPAGIAARSQPEVLGERLAGPVFDIASVAALPDGGVLAVLDDGLQRAQLLRIAADGTQQELAGVNTPARIHVAADGRVLLTQPDLCDTRYLSFDLYVLRDAALAQLTHCAHLRRAVHAGNGFVALQLDAGTTRLVALDADGGNLRVLYSPPAGTDLIDLAADGTLVSFISRTAGDWALVQLDPGNPGDMRVLARRSAPMTGLRQGAAGLEVILAEDGVYNVWRVAGAQLVRLTQTHTAVTAHSGSGRDGSLATVSIAHGGFELRRLAAANGLQSIPAAAGGAASAAPVAATAVLGAAESYAGWRSLYPHWWWPSLVADNGLTTISVATDGGDALGWHRYAATLGWETSQREPTASLQYLLLGQHAFSLTRLLEARAWTGPKDDRETTIYDRRTTAQWLSFANWPRLTRRLTLGVGAVFDRRERINLPADTSRYVRDERLAAALVDFDTRGSNWYAEGTNRGLRATLLYETYEPFAGDAPRYDGSVLRADLRGYLPLGRHVLGVRWTEARAHGRTEPFQLGGATDAQLQWGSVLGSRSVALRGYSGNEPELYGRHARVASVEWRFPIADVDRHTMVPPVGLGRLSGTLIFDRGGAWNQGHGPGSYSNSVGIELLGETKLLYAFGLQLRLGVAHGLDGDKPTRAYLTFGRAF